MQSGIHVIADHLSNYGTILSTEENALSSNNHSTPGLRDIINKLSVQLQSIAFLISIG